MVLDKTADFIRFTSAPQVSMPMWTDAIPLGAAEPCINIL